MAHRLASHSRNSGPSPVAPGLPRSAPEVTVHMEGGDARVRISPDRRATLTGATVHLGDHTVRA